MSTTTSSSTVTTATYCYVPSAAATPLLTCKKKRRSLWQSAIPAGKGIAPSSSRHSSDEDMPAVEDPNENIGSGVRDGKFANYWITTTVISTVTTFRFEHFSHFLLFTFFFYIFTIYINFQHYCHTRQHRVQPQWMVVRTVRIEEINERFFLCKCNFCFIVDLQRKIK